MAGKAEKKVFKGSLKKASEDIVIPLETTEGEVEVKALGFVSGLASIDFLEGIQSEEGATNLAAINQYLRDSFSKEEYKKFIGAVKNPENGYEMGDIAEIASYLLEQRSNKNLADSSDS